MEGRGPVTRRRSRLTGFVLSYHAVLGFFRWVEWRGCTSELGGIQGSGFGFGV